jgi:hypothetical protein
MTNPRGIDEWLAAGRADVARRGPDPMVETGLLARVRERRALHAVAAVRPRSTPARGGRPWRWLALGVPAAFAAALIALGGTRLLAPPAGSAPAEAATPFIALVGTDAIAAERAPLVVSSQVSRAVLADYGLPIDPARADQPVDADFLVTRSGIVLAVRFRE